MFSSGSMSDVQPAPAQPLPEPAVTTPEPAAAEAPAEGQTPPLRLVEQAALLTGADRMKMRWWVDRDAQSRGRPLRA